MKRAIFRLLKKGQKQIIMLLAVVLVLLPFASFQSQPSNIPLGGSTVLALGDSQGALGDSGGILGLSGELSFTLEKDVVFKGDHDFSLQDNISVTNKDGSENRNVFVVNDGNFDVDTVAEYKVTYAATDEEITSPQVETHTISVVEARDWQSERINVVSTWTDDGFPTYRNYATEVGPPRLGHRITVSINDPSLMADMSIEVDAGTLISPITGAPYFLADGHDTLPDNSFFESIQLVDGVYKITFDQNIDKKGSEEVQVYFSYNPVNYGLAKTNAPLSDSVYRVYYKDQLLEEKPIHTLVSKAASEMTLYDFSHFGAAYPKNPLGGGDYNYHITSLDALDLNPTFIYHYSQENQLPIEYTAPDSHLDLLLPLGSEVQGAQWGLTVEDDVVIGSGQYDGVPAGTYSRVRVSLDTIQSLSGNRTTLFLSPTVLFPPLGPEESHRVETIYSILQWQTRAEPGVTHSLKPTAIEYDITYQSDDEWNVDFTINYLHDTAGVLTGPNSNALNRSYVGNSSKAILQNIGGADIKNVSIRHDILKNSENPYANFSEYGIYLNNSNYQRYGPTDFTYQYYFKIKNAITGVSRSSALRSNSLVLEKTKTLSLLHIPSLVDGEYIEQVNIVPMGSDGSKPNVLPPGVAITQLIFRGTSWNHPLWPDGAPFKWGINPVKMQVFTTFFHNDLHANVELYSAPGGIHYFHQYPLDPQLDIYPSSPHSRVEPGDVLDYTLFSLPYIYTDPYYVQWYGPTFILRLPYGTTLENPDDLYFAYYRNDPTGRYPATVEPLPSVDGHNYYKISGAPDFDAAKHQTYGIVMPLQIKVGNQIPLGTHEIIGISTGLDSTNYLPRTSRALPDGCSAEDFGMHSQDYYTYRKDSRGENHFTVITNERMRSYSAIRSPYSNGWSFDELVPAAFDETVEMKLNMKSQCFSELGGLSLYNILPTPGYLGSSDVLELNLVDITVPQGTIYYYHGDSPPALTAIQSIAPQSDPGWNQSAAGATAFYVDFENLVLAENEALEVVITFKIPSETAQDQIVYNMFSYTAGKLHAGQLEDHHYYTSQKQGYSTKVYRLNYVPVPKGATIDNFPKSPVHSFTDTSGYAWVTPQVPLRRFFDFKGWNTREDGVGTTFAAGEKLTFTPEGVREISLYPQWKSNVTAGNLAVGRRGAYPALLAANPRKSHRCGLLYKDSRRAL